MTPLQARTPAPRPARNRRRPMLAILLVATTHCGHLSDAQAASDSLATSGLEPPIASAAGASLPGPAHRLLTGAIRPDRLSHASLALAIGVGAGLASGKPAAGAGAVVTLATAKELLDERFDRGDLAAGMVGAGLAWLIIAALTR